MRHLILPITIPFAGGKFCVKHGATTPKWRTLSFLDGSAALAFGEDDDQWNVDTDGINGNGTIIFGTCCIWKAPVIFTLATSDTLYTGEVALNGVVVGSFSVNGLVESSVTIEVDLNALSLMGRACGNVWSINAGFEDGDGFANLSVYVGTPSFGPPS